MPTSPGTKAAPQIAKATSVVRVAVLARLLVLRQSFAAQLEQLIGRETGVGEENMIPQDHQPHGGEGAIVHRHAHAQHNGFVGEDRQKSRNHEARARDRGESDSRKEGGVIVFANGISQEAAIMVEHRNTRPSCLAILRARLADDLQLMDDRLPHSKPIHTIRVQHCHRRGVLQSRGVELLRPQLRIVHAPRRRQSGMEKTNCTKHVEDYRDDAEDALRLARSCRPEQSNRRGNG
mmetsp:Transcript_43657/g.120827  ORF Transcript_43657/g.120827 Transcript_43657/m.120827 type:complete len:235 (-) Transcript_43657:860-1564(-)